jgi:hypothetical protein
MNTSPFFVNDKNKIRAERFLDVVAFSRGICFFFLREML